MYNRKRYRKSRSSSIRKPGFLPPFLVCVCVGLLAILYAIWPQNTVQNVKTPGMEEKFALLHSDTARPAEESRLVYPYSVIPGGIRSKEELAAHFATDNVVSDHYIDFDVLNAKIVKADRTRMMYVSYRKNENTGRGTVNFGWRF
jgi:hypothetical protein